jgi:hypothetical protein
MSPLAISTLPTALAGLILDIESEGHFSRNSVGSPIADYHPTADELNDHHWMPFYVSGQASGVQLRAVWIT